jgi:hypothetical protein
MDEKSGASDDWSGSDGSSRRVVHEPGRWTRAAAFAVLAGLAAGSLLVVLRGGVRDPREDGSDESPQADARDAYASAIGRLRRARSFAYHGTVKATETSPLRPGTWIGSPVTVEGAVLLPHDITREVAVGAGGAVVETVTSGPTVWTRSGGDAAALADVPWEVVASPDPMPARPPFPAVPLSSRLGIALVVDVLRAAGDRRADPPDASGRRALRATVPEGERYGELLMGADVSLVLDDAGDIAHLALTSAPGDGPGLVVDLEVERLGEAGLVTPEDVGEPARRAVSVDVLDAAGIHAVELDRLPSGWALTDAREMRPDPVLMCEFGGCSRPRETCPALSLDYRDLTAVWGGRLSLLVMSQSCLAGQGGSPPWREPFRAGAYAGRAETTSGLTMGTVSDSVTAVGFSTDLSTADAAAVLASLVPFDAADVPAPLAGIPSS